MILELARLAPSIVQWPELWTRGAISLATSRSPVWKNSTVEHAAVIELAQQRAEPAFGLRLERGVDVRRDRRRQDAVAMHVLRERIERALAVRALHGDQRDLALEPDPCSAIDGTRAELVPRGREVLRRCDDALTAAVVTHAPRLQHDEASRARAPRPRSARVDGDELPVVGIPS